MWIKPRGGGGGGVTYIYIGNIGMCCSDDPLFHDQQLPVPMLMVASQYSPFINMYAYWWLLLAIL